MKRVRKYRETRNNPFLGSSQYPYPQRERGVPAIGKHYADRQENLFFFFSTLVQETRTSVHGGRVYSLFPPPQKKTRLDKRREHVLRCARDISHKATREFSHADCASLFLARSTPLTGANTTRDISQLHFLPPRVNLHRLFDGRNILKKYIEEIY